MILRGIDLDVVKSQSAEAFFFFNKSENTWMKKNPKYALELVMISVCQ